MYKMGLPGFSYFLQHGRSSSLDIKKRIVGQNSSAWQLGRQRLLTTDLPSVRLAKHSRLLQNSYDCNDKQQVYCPQEVIG